MQRLAVLLRSFACAIAGALALPCAAQCTVSQATNGEWEALMNWPLQAVHAFLTKTGIVVAFMDVGHTTHPNLILFDSNSPYRAEPCPPEETPPCPTSVFS